jgi:phosphoribosylglycinamide formyltransferase-1
MTTPRITVLISGRGSNLSALLAAMQAGTLGGAITRVVSNRADAAGSPSRRRTASRRA